MSWTDIGQGGGGDFLKIETGKKIKVHVLSEEPYSFFQHFFNSIQRGAVCPGEECPACADGTKEHKKRAAHSLVVMTEAGEIKVWTASNTVMQAVKNIHDTYVDSGGIGGVDLVIIRTGTGLETKYGITPVPAAIDTSGVDMAALPVLEEINPPATVDDVASMLAGVDPSAEFNPEELEEEAVAAAEAQVAAQTPPPAQVKPKPIAAQAKPNGSADPKLPVLKDIMQALATNPKYRTPQAKALLIKKCAPGKSTVSSLTLQELMKVRSELKKA